VTGLSDGASLPAAKTWTDQKAAEVATLQTGGARAFYRTNAFGTLPGIEFGTGNPTPDIFSTASVTGVRSVFALAKCVVNSTAGIFARLPKMVVNNLYAMQGDQTVGIIADSAIDTNAVCYLDGKNVGHALNRKSYAHTFGVVAGSTASVSLFGGDGSFGFGGTIGALVLLNAVPTAAEALELSNYLHSLGGATPRALPTRAFLFLGDSLTSGGANSPTNYDSEFPGVVSRYVATTGLGLTIDDVTWQNFGSFGDTAAGCLSRAQGVVTTTIQALVAAGYTTIHCNVWIGTNNIYSGNSPATTAATTAQIGPALVTAGATKVSLLTLMARDGGGNQATYDANRATYNTSVVGMVGTGVDRVVRIDLNANMGPNGSQTNTTYFTADQIHLAASGISQIATEVQTGF
jgi:lysophospholipase L1-like esterase